MKKILFLFAIIFSFVLGSCTKELDNRPAQLIDENALHEDPKNILQFKWTGPRAQNQRLTMWKSNLDENTAGLKAPDLFRVALPVHLESTGEHDVFEIEIKTWQPTNFAQYNWKIETFYPEGVVESNIRTFVPNSKP